VQKGKFIVTKKDHWATRGMPDEFERSDEFYSFKNISPKINVVLAIDEKSYTGGKNPDFHPMSWYQEFDGGRSFYTAMGHTDETFAEPLFLNHLWAGIHYAMGGDAPKPVDFSKARPEENRFSKVILAEKLDEPMELSVLGDGRILIIQRKGEVRLYNLKTRELKTIAKLPVSTHYVSKEGKESMGEDGLLGLNKDPNFAQNHWIYLYYSDPNESKNVLARFELKGDELDMSSRKVLLDVPTQREECCHTAGSIAWDKEGNLYLSTGDNTNPHGSNGYSPSDERPGRVVPGVEADLPVPVDASARDPAQVDGGGAEAADVGDLADDAGDDLGLAGAPTGVVPEPGRDHGTGQRGRLGAADGGAVEEGAATERGGEHLAVQG